MASMRRYYHVLLLLLLIFPIALLASSPCRGNANSPDSCVWTGIVENGQRDFTPQWSPDGALIVFTFGRGGDTYVAATDGSTVRRISEDGTYKVDYSLDISPDGPRMAYATTRHEVP